MQIIYQSFANTKGPASHLIEGVKAHNLPPKNAEKEAGPTGVVLERQLAVGLLDSVFGGVLRQTQATVVALALDLRTARFRARH